MSADHTVASNVWAPPVTFYFKVEFHGGEDIPDTSFSEVSGLSTELETEVLREGGENNFVHNLPVRLKQGRLELKRALEPLDNKLESWVQKNLESGFASGFCPLNISITLLDSSGGPMAQWLCNNAYPVRWEVSTFDARKNELAIETLALNYNMLSRGM